MTILKTLMLTNTFLHIPYVSERTEQKLWQNNIRNWDDFLNKKNQVKNNNLIEKYLRLSKKQYENKNYEFFAGKLLRKYHWRAYEDFKDNCCFLDIETTGLSRQSELTVIGLYDGKKSKVYVNSKNLNEFQEDIKKYSYIVTFNGATFDLPFIKAKFPELKFNQFHCDLRFLLKKLGYSGGLKNIEKQFNINRQGDLADLSGKDAIKLWYRYKKYNDEKALDTLVRYNIEDIENLKILMDFSYDKMKKMSLNLG